MANSVSSSSSSSSSSTTATNDNNNNNDENEKLYQQQHHQQQKQQQQQQKQQSQEYALTIPEQIETAKWTQHLPEAYGIRESVRASKYRWCVRESAMWGIMTGTVMSLHRFRMNLLYSRSSSSASSASSAASSSSMATTMKKSLLYRQRARMAIHVGFVTLSIVYVGSYYFCVKRRDYREKMINLMMELNSFVPATEMPDPIPIDHNHPFVEPIDHSAAATTSSNPDMSHHIVPAQRQYVAHIPERKEWQTPIPTQDAGSMFRPVEPMNSDSSHQVPTKSKE
jgi:hypothetical protein